MKSGYGGSLISIGNWSRVSGIAGAAAFLMLAGCSSYEASTRKAAVNYHGSPATENEVDPRSIEDVIEANRDWYQMFH
jgi:hypothetical protein